MQRLHKIPLTMLNDERAVAGFIQFDPPGVITMLADIQLTVSQFISIVAKVYYRFSSKAFTAVSFPTNRNIWTRRLMAIALSDRANTNVLTFLSVVNAS